MSKKKKKALGRGLDALFPEAGQTLKDESGNIVTLSVTSIQLNPFQPRRNFDDEKLEEMATSIKERGLLQPILVRYLDKGGYQLVAGERRLRASRLAGLTEISCIVIRADDSQTLEIALIENLQRENLNPLEEARGYGKLSSRFKLTQEQIAKRVGKERSTVANSLRLLNLPPTIQEDLEVGRISPGHARALLSIENRSLQAVLWSKIVENALSVRQAEALARDIKEKKPVKGANARIKAPDIVELEEKFMGALGTRVHVQPKSKYAGKIVIHYSSLEDIDRIMERLGINEDH